MCGCIRGSRQRIQLAGLAPEQVAPQVGLGVDPRLALEPRQVGGDGHRSTGEVVTTIPETAGPDCEVSMNSSAQRPHDSVNQFIKCGMSGRSPFQFQHRTNRSRGREEEPDADVLGQGS